jgi:hypothetical protein
MTSNLLSQTDLYERAFALFLQDALTMLLNDRNPLRANDVLTFSSRVSNEWSLLSPNQKERYIEQARDQMNRLQALPGVQSILEQRS